MTKIIDGFVFEWDDNKEQVNIRKHGIDFDTATLVFEDDLRIERFDVENSTVDEFRYFTIGMIADQIAMIAVVYTERGDAVRIISARLATNDEKEEYLWHTKR